MRLRSTAPGLMKRQHRKRPEPRCIGQSHNDCRQYGGPSHSVTAAPQLRRSDISRRTAHHRCYAA